MFVKEQLLIKTKTFLNYSRVLRNSNAKLVYNHLIKYPTPFSITYFWGFGSIAGIFLTVQLVTGIVASMHYTGHVLFSFISLEHIMRDVNNGWLWRFSHANGASFFFLLVYFHLARGLYYQSFFRPRVLLWFTGVIIYIFMMATAFMGYVLPWGQMSFWGATVITNLFSAFPYVGDAIAMWLWGGFSVDNPTLNRFFSLHFLLPFIIVAVVFLHLIFLHLNGSTDPVVQAENYEDKLPFYPYYYLKDLVGLLVVFLLFFYYSYLFPDSLGHPDNYIIGNPMVTPEHIVPEWYFLPFYAILRSIPDKLGGVIFMFASLLCFFLLPFLHFNECMLLSRYNRWYEFLINFFFIIFLLLGWIGAQAVEPIIVFWGQFNTFFYFFLLFYYIIFGFFFFVFFNLGKRYKSLEDWRFVIKQHFKDINWRQIIVRLDLRLRRLYLKGLKVALVWFSGQNRSANPFFVYIRKMINRLIDSQRKTVITDNAFPYEIRWNGWHVRGLNPYGFFTYEELADYDKYITDEEYERLLLFATAWGYFLTREDVLYCLEDEGADIWTFRSYDLHLEMLIRNITIVKVRCMKKMGLKFDHNLYLKDYPRNVKKRNQYSKFCDVYFVNVIKYFNEDLRIGFALLEEVERRSGTKKIWLLRVSLELLVLTGYLVKLRVALQARIRLEELDLEEEKNIKGVEVVESFLDNSFFEPSGTFFYIRGLFKKIRFFMKEVVFRFAVFIKKFFFEKDYYSITKLKHFFKSRFYIMVYPAIWKQRVKFLKFLRKIRILRRVLFYFLRVRTIRWVFMFYGFVLEKKVSVWQMDFFGIKKTKSGLFFLTKSTRLRRKWVFFFICFLVALFLFGVDAFLFIEKFFFLLFFSLGVKGLLLYFLFEKKMKIRDGIFLLFFLFFSIAPLIYICCSEIAELNFLLLLILLELSAFSTLCVIGFKKESFSVLASSLFFFLGNMLITSLFIFGVLLWYMANGSLSFVSVDSVITQVSDFALFFMLISIIIKLGLFPGHLWFVSVLKNTSPGAFIYLQTFYKLFSFGFFIVFLRGVVYPNISEAFYSQVLGALVFIGFLTFLVCSVLALRVDSLKSQWAYLSTGTSGFVFMLIGIDENIAAFLYFLPYIFFSLLFWFLIMRFNHSFLHWGIFSKKKNKLFPKLEIVFVSDLKQLRYFKGFSLWMILILLSLTGIPPLFLVYFKLVSYAVLVLHLPLPIVFLINVVHLIPTYIYLKYIKIILLDKNSFDEEELFEEKFFLLNFVRYNKDGELCWNRAFFLEEVLWHYLFISFFVLQFKLDFFLTILQNISWLA